ncbi:capsular biosynthesis protein CpsS [Lactobacillus sp. UMNPBX5]|nr:capsular biosynthesis protein CpsS [Lactobacillus sp. UMNPBX5]
MLVALRIISIIISTLILVKIFYSIRQFHPLVPIVIVFDFAMVLPILLELFLGNPETSYLNFQIAMNDLVTNILFNVFVISAQLAFLLEIHKIERIDNKMVSKDFLFDNKKSVESHYTNSFQNFILIFAYIVPFLAIIAICVSPNPGYYFKLFDNVYGGLDPKIVTYNEVVMNNIMYLLILALGILKWFDWRDKFSSRLIRIGYIALIMIVNHKRTFLMVAVGLCLIIDIMKSKKIKKILPRYLIYISFVAFYFVFYSYATGKVAFNNNWYYIVNEYFFRAIHMKFAIYAAIHPQYIHILDYPGQSILFDLFYFIPRSFWPNKPLPYVTYFISGAMNNRASGQFPVQMPTSYYPEFVSNFGVLGIWISIIFTIWIARFFDKRDVMCKMLGTTLICLLEIYYYDNMLKILAVFILILYLFEKNKKGKESNLINY